MVLVNIGFTVVALFSSAIILCEAYDAVTFKPRDQEFLPGVHPQRK
jgi:hypothetical protein